MKSVVKSFIQAGVRQTVSRPAVLAMQMQGARGISSAALFNGSKENWKNQVYPCIFGFIDKEEVFDSDYNSSGMLLS